MKKKILPAGIALFLIITAGSSCKKDNKVTYLSFAGNTHGSFDFQSLDYSTGVFQRDKWDSTYNDIVDVVIDRNEKTIKFTFHPNNYKAQPSKQVYTYPLDESANAYSTQHASHVSQSFALTGDSLKTDYEYYSGYNASYTSTTILFAGRRIN